MTYPGFGEAEVVGDFVNQGLFDLFFNILFGAADGKDGLSKQNDAVRKALSLKKTFPRPGDPLIQAKKEVPPGHSQFFQ